MSALAIFQDVMDKLQEAEELGGPVGQEYVNLMSSIAAVCTMRANNAACLLEESKNEEHN